MKLNKKGKFLSSKYQSSAHTPARPVTAVNNDVSAKTKLIRKTLEQTA